MFVLGAKPRERMEALGAARGIRHVPAWKQREKVSVNDLIRRKLKVHD